MNDTAHALWASLPLLAERTEAQLIELHKDCTSERAFIASRAAYEVYVSLRRLGGELGRGEVKAA